MIEFKYTKTEIFKYYAQIISEILSHDIHIMFELFKGFENIFF